MQATTRNRSDAPGAANSSLIPELADIAVDLTAELAHADEPPAKDPPDQEPPLDDPPEKEPPIEEPGQPAPKRSA
jgi:hypothetical protein